MTGFSGTFVVSWSQTEIDGLAGAPAASLDVGVTWRWHGTPVRVDGPNDVLVLRNPEGEAELRRRAARTVRRLMCKSLAGPRATDPDWDEPVFDRYFVVTDGRRSYPITLIELSQSARPLLLFLDRIPPRDCDLWVTESLEQTSPAHRRGGGDTGVICFVGGTLLRTPKGLRPVETLAPGDLVDTRDGGAQAVQWVGHRRVSGARMVAMPDLRPVRIRTGALGVTRPSPDLLVSPRHRILVRGEMAQALFNTPEVLVAASDMINDRTVTLDHSRREIVYHHIMLPAHHIVWANGVATESFHPAHADLESLAPDQRERLIATNPALQSDPHRFGDPARRMLSTSEAAILLQQTRNGGRGIWRTDARGMGAAQG